jgi:hypothetical protein
VPYANPEMKKLWEQRHRSERLARRRELRRISAANYPAAHATGEPEFPWYLLAGGIALAIYNPALALIISSGIAIISAAKHAGWQWFVLAALIGALALFLLLFNSSA